MYVCACERVDSKKLKQKRVISIERRISRGRRSSRSRWSSVWCGVSVWQWWWWICWCGVRLETMWCVWCGVACEWMKCVWCLYSSVQWRSRRSEGFRRKNIITALVHSQLDYCNVVFAGLPAWHPATTVSPQHSRTFGRRLIATRSRDFSAMRPPLAASQTARRVQAVYVGTSLLVRRCTILPGGPDHAVGRCNCQTWSQICRIQFSCNAMNYIVARRPVLRGCWPTCMEQTSSRLLSWYF